MVMFFSIVLRKFEKVAKSAEKRKRDNLSDVTSAPGGRRASGGTFK
jgi:hypothetical protein